MYCLDANVWIYFLDAGLTEHDRVREQVADVVRTAPLFTTTVLQMEVVHYLHGQLDRAVDAVDSFLSVEDVTVAALTPADVERAATLLGAHEHVGIGGRDATVLAAMERHDVSRLWTHDAALKQMDERFDWLSVRDPVTE